MPAMSPNGGLPHGSDDTGREPSPYVELERAAWAALALDAESPLTQEEIARLRGLGDSLDLDEVQQVYLPLSRLLSLYVESAGRLHRQQEEFLDRPQPPRTPFVIGLAGSVAVGKSTTARVLQQMLAHWPEHPNVALVTTDGFLHPNARAAAAAACSSARASRSPTTAGPCCGSWSTSSRARTRWRRRSTPTWSTTWCPTRRS